jgi:hypothetical protein
MQTAGKRSTIKRKNTLHLHCSVICHAARPGQACRERIDTPLPPLAGNSLSENTLFVKRDQWIE